MTSISLPASEHAGIKPRMARRKLFERQRNLNLLLAEDTVERIDAACELGETRTSFLRRAINEELRRRESAKARKRRKA